MLTRADIGNLNGYSNAITRWATFGPYYAMFPIDFAFQVVEKYSNPGDYIIDPFAGRCSSIYAGGVLGRNSLGIEINPLGWIYGTVKLNPAPKQDVINRLWDIYVKRENYRGQTEQMSEFFQLCYYQDTLSFLLSARDNLNWRSDNVDRTLVSIILVYLHGKLGEGLSNQLRQTKAMGPDYSIRWWKDHDMTSPPQINPYEFIKKKIEWRYAKDTPQIDTNCQVIFGDSTVELEKIVNRSKEKNIKYSLLFTSPPYRAIVNYHTDQWLRLWMLGGVDRPKATSEKYKGRFYSKELYNDLLVKVFSDSAKMMDDKSTILVRTDARKFTYETTLQILKNSFPNYTLKIKEQPLKKLTQTDLYNKKSKKKPGEIDIILQGE